MNSKVRKKLADLLCSHLGGMSLAMKQHIALCPVHIRLLGSLAHPADTNCITDLIEKLRFGHWRSPAYFWQRSAALTFSVIERLTTINSSKARSAGFTALIACYAPDVRQ